MIDQINLEQVQGVFYLFSYARSLWGAFLSQIKTETNENTKTQKIEQLVDIAMQKLKHRDGALTVAKNKDSDFAFAIT